MWPSVLLSGVLKTDTFYIWNTGNANSGIAILFATKIGCFSQKSQAEKVAAYWSFLNDFSSQIPQDIWGRKGTLIRKTVPAQLNLKSKFSLSSAMSSPFDLGMWWIQYAGLKSSGNGKLNVRMLKRARTRSLLWLGFYVLLHHMQLCRELRHILRSTQAVLGWSSNLFRFIENMLIKISGCQLVCSQRQGPLRGCNKWSWCRQYWAAICPACQHLLWCEEQRHKSLKKKKKKPTKFLPAVPTFCSFLRSTVPHLIGKPYCHCSSLLVTSILGN